MIPPPINQLAQLISLITNPALVMTLTMLTVISYYTGTSQEFWRGSLIGFGLLVAPGLLYSVSIWRKGGVIDLDLTNRHDRVVPLMLSSLGAVIGNFIIQTRLDNPTFTKLSFILAIMLVALTVVTTVWKISLHAATLAALVTLLVIFRGQWFVVGYLLLIPIVWARLTLKQHSPNQLIGGSLLGAALTFVAATFFSH